MFFKIPEYIRHYSNDFIAGCVIRGLKYKHLFTKHQFQRNSEVIEMINILVRYTENLLHMFEKYKFM